MKFTENQMRVTHYFISKADEINLQTLMSSLTANQIKKLMRAAYRSLDNKGLSHDVLCDNRKISQSSDENNGENIRTDKHFDKSRDCLQIERT